jgi:hypothetical protein
MVLHINTIHQHLENLCGKYVKFWTQSKSMIVRPILEMLLLNVFLCMHISHYKGTFKKKKKKRTGGPMKWDGGSSRGANAGG